MNSYPRFVPVGDQALLIEFGEVIDDRLNARVQALAAAVADIDGVQDIIPTYRSLTLQFDPLVIELTDLCRACGDRLNHLALSSAPSRCWRVPVCYGGSCGEDLSSLAAEHQLSAEQAIALHCGAVYRVFMVGFMPGFAYLGGLPAALHTPRRSAPRAITPASSINIGGQQTAISSVAGPSGWHLIGRTPWRSFSPARQPAFLFQAGDAIIFEPISLEAFRRLEPICANPRWLPEAEKAS